MSDTEHHNGAAANIQDVSTADAPPAVVEAPAEGETTVTQESTDAAAGTGNVAHERRGSAVAHHEHDHDRHRNLTGVQGGKEIVDDRLQASGSVHSATHGAHHHHRPVAAGSVEVHDDDAAPLPRTRLFDLDSVRGASAENVNTNASNSGVFANDTAGRSASGSVGGGANAPPTVLPNNMRSVRLGGQIPAFAAVESSKYPKVMLGVEFWNEVTSALKRSMGDSPRPGGASPMRSGATTPRSRSATPNLTGAHSPSAHSPRGYGSRRSGSPVAGHTLNAANVARHNATLGTGTADDLHSAALFEAHSIELAGDKVGVPAAGLTAALCAIGGDCPERVAAAVLFQLAPPGFSNTLPEPQFMKALQVTRAVLTRHSMARQLRTRTPERHRTDGSLVPAEGKPLQEILGVVPLGEVADARAGPRSNRSLSMSSGVAGRATSPRGATAGDSKTAKSTPRSSYPTRAYQPHAGTQSHVTGTTTMRRSLSPAMAIGGQGVHTQTLQSVRAAAIGAAKRSAVEATEAEEAVRRDGALAASHGRPERMSPARIQQRAASPGPGPGPGSPRGQQPGPGSPRAPSPRVTGARPVSSNTPFHSTAQRLSSPIRTASSNIPGRRAVPPPTPPRTSSPAAVGRQSPRPMSRGPTPTRTAPAPVPSPVTARPRSTLRTGPQPQLRAAGSSPTAAQRNASPIGSPRTLSPTVPPRRSVPTAISSPLPTTGAWRPGGGVGAVRRGGTPTRASYPSPAAVRSPRPTQRPGTPPNERQQDDSAMLHTPRSQTDAPVGAGPASPSSASFLTPPRGTDRSTAKGSPSSPRPYNSGPQPPAAITATTRVVRSSGYQPIGAVSRTSLGTNVRPPRVAYLAPSPTKSPRPNTGSPAASPAKSSPVRSVPVSIPTSYGSSPSSMRRRPMTPEEMAQVLSPEAKARRHASSLPTRNSLVQREPKLVHCRDGELAMR